MSLTPSYPFLTGTNNSPGNFQAQANFVWDTGSLSWVKMTQPGGGGGGGAVTVADGADVTQGAIADAAVTSNAAGTLSAKLRGLVAILADVWDSVNHRLNVAVQNTVTVSGSVAATQSGAWTVAATQSGVWNVTSTISGTVTVTGTVAATQSGAWSTGRTWTLSNATDSVAAAQSGTWNVGVTGTVTVSGTVTANQGGSWTVAATQSGLWSTGRTWTLASGTDSVTITGSVSVTGTATVAGVVSTKTDLTPASPTAVSVGVASGTLVAANANRKGLVLVNTSTARVSLGFGVAAVLDSGITLYPSDSFSMDEYSFDTGAINAIASAAASNVGIQEFST